MSKIWTKSSAIRMTLKTRPAVATSRTNSTVFRSRVPGYLSPSGYRTGIGKGVPSNASQCLVKESLGLTKVLNQEVTT